MIKHFQLIRLLILPVFLYTLSGFAQDDEPATVPAPEPDTEETVPAGQEVEINEDNYRQFMELKDARQQRNILPETAYRSQAGMQKIEKLPEDSQKHLRNQLREIIIKGDQWQPGDEGGDYPYVPSEAAKTDQALQKLEAEAWGELVDNYHKREAEIYANSSRSKAAAATASASGGNSGSHEGSQGGSAGQDGTDQQANRQSSSRQNSSADNYSPDAANDPNAKSTEGVSQNALEFLQQSGNQTANAGNTGTGSPDRSEGRGTEQADAVTGASQNALEYLMGEDTQTDRSANNESDTDDTLTIEDLMNAQGIRGAAGTASPPGNTNDDEEPVEKPPAEDEG